MKCIGYLFAKIKYVLKKHDKEVLNDFFRKYGVTIGENTKIASNILSAEPYLIEIGDNVTISHDVDFITHDNSVCKLFGVDHDLYGKITIGNNCFIGAHAIIMYGITLPNNTIVAAGSVVTKTPEQENLVIGGNPARVIGTWEKFKVKTEQKEIHAGHLSFAEKKKFIIDSKERWVNR